MGGLDLALKRGIGRACSCMSAVLPLVEEEFLLRGLIKSNIDYFQLGFNRGVAPSAQTHWGGGVFDTNQYTDDHLRIWRQWGCEVQHRTPAQGFDPHGHGVIKGCPHVSAGRLGAEWQAQEWEQGRNGLRGQGPITGPGPKGKDTPTWKQAVNDRKKILVSLKDDIAAEVVAQLRKEYPAIADAVLERDVVPNTFTANEKNKTATPKTALTYLGKNDNQMNAKLDQILARLPKDAA